ncbi:hypothetical protein DPX39_020016600 [Trypanosoma brucei equiperdum]|nr:hypothetical protein DPX39_020016600 [Trypanosoma brucei equiperdum]
MQNPTIYRNYEAMRGPSGAIHERDTAPHIMSLFAELESHTHKPVVMYRKLLHQAARQLNDEATANMELRKEIAIMRKNEKRNEGRIQKLEGYISKLRKRVEDGEERINLIAKGARRTSVPVAPSRSRGKRSPTSRNGKAASHGGVVGNTKERRVPSPAAKHREGVVTSSRATSQSPFVSIRSYEQDGEERDETAPSLSLKRRSVNQSRKGGYDDTRKMVAPVRREGTLDKILIDVFVLLLSEEPSESSLPDVGKYGLTEDSRARCEAVFSAIVRLREEVAVTRRHNAELMKIVRRKESMRMLTSAAAEEQATLEMLRGKGCSGIDEGEYLSSITLTTLPYGESNGKCGEKYRAAKNDGAGYNTLLHTPSVSNVRRGSEGSGVSNLQPRNSEDGDGDGRTFNDLSDTVLGALINGVDHTKVNKWERSLLSR